jgi:hypothetical protein
VVARSTLEEFHPEARSALRLSSLAIDSRRVSARAATELIAVRIRTDGMTTVMAHDQ